MQHQNLNHSPATRSSWGRRLLVLGLFPLALGGLTACKDEAVVADLKLEIHGPDDSPSLDTIGFPKDVDQCVDTIRVTSYDGLKVLDQENLRWNQQGFRMPTIPFDADAWISVEGLSSGDPGCLGEGQVVASGATPRLNYDADNLGPLDLNILTSHSGRFGKAYYYDRDRESSLELLYELPNQERAGHTFTELKDRSGFLMIGGAKMDGAGIGGSGISQLVDTIEFYDAFSGQFLALYEEGCDGDANTCALRLPQGTAFHTATLLNDGRILIVGGLTSLAGSALVPTSRAYVLQVTGYAEGWLDEVHFAPDATQVARAFHTATRMADGRVVLIGGIGGAYEQNASYLNSVQQVFPGRELEIEDSGISLGAGRAFHTATYFSRDDHGIIVVGGRDRDTVVSATEVVFTEGNKLSLPLEVEALTPLNTAQDLRANRFGHSAAVFSCPGDSQQYLAVLGGYTATGSLPMEGSSPTAMVEVYDPGARFRGAQAYEFTDSTATLPGGGRAFGAAIGLPLSGDVLFMGGIGEDGKPTNKADRLQNDWNPCSNLSQPQAVAGGMVRARAHAPAALLSTGFVMTTGGQGASASLEQSEFYNPGDYDLVGLR